MFFVIFFKNITEYPAINPPISPPKKPAPWLAIYPATAPGINPGLSAILIAINPARIGIKKWKAPAPTSNNNLNN